MKVNRIYRISKYGKPIIVVSGLPRSGTSMLMLMLKAGGVEIATDNVRRADEDNPRGYFELEKGMVTSLDLHGFEHEIFILKGKGKLFLEGEEYDLRPHDAVLIEGNEQHQLKQEGDETLGFLCIVPNGVSTSKGVVDVHYGVKK